MTDRELDIISIIAKELKRNIPSMPMDLATGYAEKILESLQGNDYLL